MPRSNTNARAGNLSIGDLSRQTGVNIETIRYYERIGLLAARGPSATPSLIRRSRDLGFSINDTHDLLGLARGHNLTCARVKALTEQHVADVRTKIRDLESSIGFSASWLQDAKGHLFRTVRSLMRLPAILGARSSSE